MDFQKFTLDRFKTATSEQIHRNFVFSQLAGKCPLRNVHVKFWHLKFLCNKTMEFVSGVRGGGGRRKSRSHF